jgi:hypothetical protein
LLADHQALLRCCERLQLFSQRTLERGFPDVQLTQLLHRRIELLLQLHRIHK